MKVIKGIIANKVGTDGYELEEFEKADGGDIQEVVKQKVLAIGPFSVVGQTESLDIGESFDDWDYWYYVVSLSSDTNLTTRTPISSSKLIGLVVRAYSGSEYLQMSKLSSTTFELTSKTTSAGNIQRIIGVKL